MKHIRYFYYVDLFLLSTHAHTNEVIKNFKELKTRIQVDVGENWKADYPFNERIYQNDPYQHLD